MELDPKLSLATIGLAVPIFQALFPYDVYVDISDQERFVFVSQAKSFRLNVSVGDPIPEGSMAQKMLATGAPTSTRATRETTIFGFPYIARGLPLRQNDQLVGTMTLAMNVDDMEQMEALSQKLLNFLEVSNQRVSELSEGSAQLAATADRMIKEGETTNQKSEKMLASLSEVQKLAQQSHVLSINTSIEAARLGEQGRSFAVIAQYMQSLASSSLDSGQNINEGLDSFRNNLSATMDSLAKINQIVQQQTIDITELTNAGKEVEVLTQHLAQIDLFNFTK